MTLFAILVHKDINHFNHMKNAAPLLSNIANPVQEILKNALLANLVTMKQEGLAVLLLFPNANLVQPTLFSATNAKLGIF